MPLRKMANLSRTKKNLVLLLLLVIASIELDILDTNMMCMVTVVKCL